jgi:hypothetical protein
MVGKRLNQMIQTWLMIELKLELGNDTLHQDVCPDTVWQIFDTGCPFPNFLGHADYRTYLMLEQVCTILDVFGLHFGDSRG